MSSLVKKANRASTATLSRVIEKQCQIQQENYSMSVLRASEISRGLQEAVWALFRENMEEWYKSTDVFDWDPVEKRSELFDRSSRFLLMTKEGGQLESNLVAYSMFRFDAEEDMNGGEEEVLYCYELQVSETSRGLGIGKILVRSLEKLCRQWRMEKVMLTVLKANVGAVRFYQREGFGTDAVSPEDEGYLIFSKALPLGP